MAENSKIEWTDHTFNPWIGCQKVSPGCDHCYAESMSNRYGWTTWGPHGERKRTSDANWKKPRQWAKAARGTGKRPRVFCASLADVWDNQVPAEWRRDLFHLIWETPELDWLLLTKRPENIAKMLLPAIGEAELWPWPNVWLGTTVEDQERANRIGDLLRIPAAVHFLSCEPMLSDIKIDTYFSAYWTAINCPQPSLPDGSWRGQRVAWVICGGESGQSARQMDPQWARDLRDQCADAGVAFFMKQMTGKKPIPDDLLVRQFPI